MLVSLLGLESDMAKGILVMSVIVFGFVVIMLLAAMFATIMGKCDE